MWQANSAVLITDLGDELVLMHPERSEMFSLNATGKLLWQQLPATLDSLSHSLEQTYGLTPSQARDDAEAVLEQLRTRDLVNCV